MAKKGTIVIDAGHGGKDPGTKSATTQEKSITLDIAQLTHTALTSQATTGGDDVTVLMTRDSDVFLELADRPAVAKTNDADIFLSIHCNANNEKTAELDKKRGVTAFVRRVDEATVPVESRQTDALVAVDETLANAVVNAVYLAIQTHDSNAAKLDIQRSGMAVLNRQYLGTKAKGCLLEVEFIDVPAVEVLLNTGANHVQVRTDIAAAIAKTLIDSL